MCKEYKEQIYNLNGYTFKICNHIKFFFLSKSYNR